MPSVMIGDTHAVLKLYTVSPVLVATYFESYLFRKTTYKFLN